MKLILSNNTEIEVLESSTLFDIQISPSQYQDMWEQLVPENMTILKMTTDDGTLMDQRENLVIDSERSIKEGGVIHCHFYLREKNREELLEEEVAMLKAQLEIHDVAIGDLGAAVSGLAEEGGLIDG